MESVFFCIKSPIAASALATNTTNTTTTRPENSSTTPEAQPMGVTEIVAVAVGFLLLLLFSVGLSILLLQKKKRIDKDDLGGKLAAKPQFKADAKGKESKCQLISQSKVTTSDLSLPPHMVLTKGPNLREVAKEMAGAKCKLNEEFKLMADHVRINFKKKCKVGRLENNKPHNRYLDIGKY